ncbi:MAG: NUDIX hydrolase [Planctomycetales bacterium]|nr:NUDIX hydrolase [Planctomycetales bacterium]
MAKKPDWLFQQAAGLPYFSDQGEVRVVLVTSRSSKKWIFPKGVIDPGETRESTAVKEAWEEAGVQGEVTGDPLGCYEQAKWGGVATIEVLPLGCWTLAPTWDEDATRERQCVSVDEARALVGEPLERIVSRLQERVTSGELAIRELRFPAS